MFINFNCFIEFIDTLLTWVKICFSPGLKLPGAAVKINSVLQVFSFHLILVFFPFAIYAQNHSNVTEEEALFVRRILEFWKDKEPKIVKAQITKFLHQYPQSEYTDSLLVILGDLYWNEQNYQEALYAYNRIASPLFRDKVFNNRLDCLYHLEKHYELTGEIDSKMEFQKQKPESPEQALWMYYFAEGLLQQGKKNLDANEAQANYDLAREYYELLEDSPHAVNAKLGLAEIYTLVDDPIQAANLYLDLADTFPDKREEMLWQAAQIQQKIDPEESLRLYSILMEMNGQKSADAAYNKLLLLFGERLFEQLIEEQTDIKQQLAKEKQPLFAFYLGHSYFHLGDHENTIALLEPFFKDSTQFPHHDTSFEKDILLTLLTSYYHTNNLPQVEHLANRFENIFPSDPDLPKVLYFLATAYKNQGDLHQSLNTLEKTIRAFPKYEGADHLLFEKGIVLLRMKRWDDSRAIFKNFIQSYPDSSLVHIAYQYLPNVTLQMMDETGLNENLELRQQLLEEMQAALDYPEAIKTEQRPRYLLKIAKTWYDLKEHQKAIDTLNEYVENHPEDPQLFQAHLLMATCYHEGKQDLANFVRHAEQVLILNPHFSDQCKLRLNLFSTCLRLTQPEEEIQAETENPYFDKAAEHLYHVLGTDPEKIKFENQLWLANYYYNKVKTLSNEYTIEPLENIDILKLAQKGVVIYENAFDIGTGPPSDAIRPETLYLEHELFKLSNLYGWVNQTEAQLNLLNDLINQQKENPQWSWTLPSRTVFALANALRLKGDMAKALDNYCSLATHCKTTDPYISNASKLHWARLTFASLPQEKLNDEDEEIITILKTLKDLQIRKTLIHEPLHLEAALDYVAIRTSLEPLEKQQEMRYFLLTRMKEEFSNKEDLWSKDYNASRESYPEKDLIYQAYMMLVEAHLLKLEAKAAEKKGNALEQKAKTEAAEAIYKNLLQGQFAVSSYAIEQAKKELDDL